MSDICEQFSPHYETRKDRYEAMVLEVSGLSELFKALADETRTRILYLLSEGELCVCDLAAILNMSLPAVSHHLRLLKVMRLVGFRKEGKQVFYHLADEHVLLLIKVALEHFAEEREGAKI